MLLAAGAALGALWARSDNAPEHQVVRGSSTEEFDPGTEPALTEPVLAEPAVTAPRDPEPPQAEVPPESVPGARESPIADEPWPTYGYDVARSHVAPPSADHRPPYSRLWAVRSGGNIELPPTVAYGRVYLAEGRGRFFAIDAESGEVVWEKHFSENCTAASPTVYDGLVFQPYLPAPCSYGSRDATGFLVAMDAASGKERWRFPVSSESTPLVVDGTLYVGSWDGRLYALNARTGKQRWAFDAGEELNSAAAYADGVVYIGSDGSQVFAVDAATGAERWRAAGFSRGQREYFYATPTVAYGRVFIGNTDGMVYAFGATSGKLLWAQSAGTYVYSAAAVWRQTVYVGSYDGNFYALDAATGDVRWTYELTGIHPRARPPSWAASSISPPAVPAAPTDLASQSRGRVVRTRSTRGRGSWSGSSPTGTTRRSSQIASASTSSARGPCTRSPSAGGRASPVASADPGYSCNVARVPTDPSGTR